MKNIRERDGFYFVKIRLYGRLRSFGKFKELSDAVAVRNHVMDKHRQGLTIDQKKTGYGVKGTTAQFTFQGERILLGTFPDANLAAAAVNDFFIKQGKEPPNEVDQNAVDLYNAKQRIKVEHAVRNTRMEIKKKHGPEWYIQQAIKKFLEERGWMVKVMAAHKFLWGMPDLFACHKIYGPRFIEVKNPAKFEFTNAQLQDFPDWVAHGLVIHVMTGANEENYSRLFKASNLWVYMGGFSDGK